MTAPYLSGHLSGVLRLPPPIALFVSLSSLFLSSSSYVLLASTDNFLLSEYNSEIIPESHHRRDALYSRRGALSGYSRRVVLVEPVTTCLHSEYFPRAWTLQGESHDRMQLACCACTQWRHNRLQLARCGHTDRRARCDSAPLQESRFENAHARGKSSLGASSHSQRMRECRYTFLTSELCMKLRKRNPLHLYPIHAEDQVPRKHLHTNTRSGLSPCACPHEVAKFCGCTFRLFAGVRARVHLLI